MKRLNIFKSNELDPKFQTFSSMLLRLASKTLTYDRQKEHLARVDAPTKCDSRNDVHVQSVDENISRMEALGQRIPGLFTDQAGHIH